MIRLYRDPAEARRMAAGASAGLATLSGALDRTVAALEELLPAAQHEETVERA